MVRRIPVHMKVAAALLVPLIALAAVVVVEVLQSSREVDEVRGEAAVVRAATGPTGLFNALQDERNRAGITMVGQGGLVELPCEDNAACRDETDRSLAEFGAQIGGEEEVGEAYAAAFTKLEELGTLRADIDADPGPSDLRNLDAAERMFDRYTEIIGVLLESNASVALAIDDPELRRGADLSYTASRNADLIARIVAALLESAVRSNGVNGPGLDQPAEVAEVGGLFGLVERNYLTILDMATGEYAPSASKLAAENDAAGFLDLVPHIIETGQIRIDELLGSVSVGRDEGYYGFRSGVKEVVETKADELAADAERRARLFQALAGLALVVAALATWLVSRSITRPLRALTRQAREMANHRLPDAVLDILDTPLGDDVTVPGIEPVHVNTRDEVGGVADALNTVQDSALDLAVEQAVLRRNIADSFVNLGRRNQNLLGRQLDFITELEHNETDPDTLANLFRLDHLATRMRRNAESLLVLAGIDPPRKWAAPVRITDAIRAALGEVEDYQRVTVRAVEPATILGSAAADLAHLLAELIENALLFSPPDQTVEIRGRDHTGGARANGYTLAVIDSGLGMRPQELDDANRRLAGAESFTIAPSKYLGHYVAGNLAARHNIAVVVHNSTGQPGPSTGHGITATINLPPTLLTAEPTPGQSDASGIGPVPQAINELMLAMTPEVIAHTASGPTRRTPAAGSSQRRPTTRPADTPIDALIHALSHLRNKSVHGPLSPAIRPAPAPPLTPANPAIPTPALNHPQPFAVPSPSRYRAPAPPTAPASGLTRRVRAAQLPATDTVRRSRGTGRPATVPSEPRLPASGGVLPAARRGTQSIEDRAATWHSAEDIYRFLHQLTAGIQRGLEDSHSVGPGGN